MSKAYELALLKARKESAEFEAAKQAYRSLKIGDKEFLAAQEKYKLSEVEFDAAFAKESKGK